MEIRNPLVSAEEISDILLYSPVTGEYTWRRKPARRIVVGSRAGYVGVGGYRLLKVTGYTFLEHRLAFLLMTGSLPTTEVDHINGVRSDNRWANLRLAEHFENHQNRGHCAAANSKLGVRPTPAGSWMARIKHKGETHYLGTFSTPDGAHAAYLKAKAEMHRFNPTPRAIVP